MKTLSVMVLMTGMVIISTISIAQKKVKEDSITVYGNCQECKERIEASLDLAGVKYAAWNIKTKKLFVAYKPSKISEEKIHQAVAGVGHDTDKVKAQDSVYTNLSFCCLYRDGNPHGPNEEEQKDDHYKEHQGSQSHKQHH